MEFEVNFEAPRPALASFYESEAKAKANREMNLFEV